MDKRLIDIVEEETEVIAELGEIDRRIAKAEYKKERMYELWIDGLEEVLPYIEQLESDIPGMYDVRKDYKNRLTDIRERIASIAREMVEHNTVVYASPRLREGLTLQEAKDLLIASQEKLRKRVPGRRSMRRGRVKYVRIDKKQAGSGRTE